MANEQIDICVCTYRRDSLDRTLESIAVQTVPPGYRLRVIVADNDITDQKRGHIEACARALSLDLHYIHAPSQNISIARNACLDAAGKNLLIYIDDDEVADPRWLELLLGARSRAPIVFGISQARYSLPSHQAWIAHGDFHSAKMLKNDAAWKGYTGNVMMDGKVLSEHGLRFDISLGQIGGEDTMFFFQAYQAGIPSAYLDDAIVFEDVPSDRATLSWLIRRRYRSGQVHYLVLMRNRQASRAYLSAIKLIWCLVRVAMPPFSRTGAASSLLRGVLHAGVIAAALGFASYREYAPSVSRS